MNVDKRFPIQIAVTLVVGLIAGTGLMAATGLLTAGTVVAVLIGAVLSTINVMSGFLAIEYSIDKSHTTFMKAVLGGMGVRMAVTLVLLALLIKFANIHAVALVVSVLSFYVVYLVLEILYMQKRLSHKSE